MNLEDIIEKKDIDEDAVDYDSDYEKKKKKGSKNKRRGEKNVVTDIAVELENTTKKQKKEDDLSVDVVKATQPEEQLDPVGNEISKGINCEADCVEAAELVEACEFDCESTETVVVAGSGLDKETRALYNEFLMLSKCKTSQDFTCNEDRDDLKNVTHLVVNVDDNMRAKRTTKYLTAILMGIYIVSTDWISACLSAKHKVLEDNFLVYGDTQGGTIPLYLYPHHVSSTKPIFDGFTFCMIPSMDPKIKLTMTKLLNLGGGRVMMEIASFLEESNKSQAEGDYYLLTDATSPETSRDEVKEMISSGSCFTAVTLLNRCWIVDSIASFDRYLGFDEYVVPTVV